MDQPEWCERYQSRFQAVRYSWGDTIHETADLVGLEQCLMEEVEAGRTTLPKGSLAILSRRWGVTTAYLLGELDAERDLPEIRAAKEKLRLVLLEREQELGFLGPRIRFVLRFLMKAEPDIYTEDFVSRALLIHQDDLRALMAERTGIARGVISQVSILSGIPAAWFWQWEANLLVAEQEPTRRREAENGPIWPWDL